MHIVCLLDMAITYPVKSNEEMIALEQIESAATSVSVNSNGWTKLGEMIVPLIVILMAVWKLWKGLWCSFRMIWMSVCVSIERPFDFTRFHCVLGYISHYKPSSGSAEMCIIKLISPSTMPSSLKPPVTTRSGYLSMSIGPVLRDRQSPSFTLACNSGNVDLAISMNSDSNLLAHSAICCWHLRCFWWVK